MNRPTDLGCDAAVRAGVDLVSISQVAASIDRFGDRYLRRVYSPRELAECDDHPEVRSARLAARFAAKEAVRKVLRAPEHQPAWTAIEILRAPWGGCDIHLTGEAARYAEAEGIGSWSMSLTHEAGMAAAVVVAQCDDVRRPVEGPVPAGALEKGRRS